MSKKEIIYVGDPMCSWCWGFSPVIKKIKSDYRNWVTISLIVGGLRTGTDEIMDESMKGYIRHHWESVKTTTGQTFNFDFFERDDFVYDTLPPCKAVVAFRDKQPDKVFEYFDALQNAFYAKNSDITNPSVLAEIASEFGVDTDEFLALFNSEDIGFLTPFDFQFARDNGVSGFPSVLLRTSNDFIRLATGYQPFEAIVHDLETWILEDS